MDAAARAAEGGESMSTTYRVPFSGYTIVEADSPEEALEIAMEGYPIVEEVQTYEEAKEV